MAETKRTVQRSNPAGRVDVVPRDYAGKWIAWSSDGRRIVAVAETFQACEKAVLRAGFSSADIAIERVPNTRQRDTGSTM